MKYVSKCNGQTFAQITQLQLKLEHELQNTRHQTTSASHEPLQNYANFYVIPALVNTLISPIRNARHKLSEKKKHFSHIHQIV